MARLHLKVGGMHCSFCSQSVERAYARTEGVEEVSVSLAHEEALVEYDPEVVDETTLRDTLRDVGYTIRDPDRERAFEEARQELRDKRDRTILAGAASGAVALVMAGMWVEWLPDPLPLWALLAEGALAAWVLLGPGREIVGMALAGVRRRILNQHVLLFAGALGGFLAGILGFFLPGFPVFHFFGAAVFLMAYHLLSGWAATKVRARSREAVRALLDLRPDTARLIGDGRVREVPVAEVEAGDRLRVKPGESVPLDGRVLDGQSTVDESIVTGEPIPAEKAEGDEVIGGSLNQAGTLVVEVTRTGEEGFLSRVARQVEEARALKPGVIQLVDRVLRYYVPAVLLIGAAAFLFWTFGGWAVAGAPDVGRGVFAALTVYVMGYPCALGMATPLALIRGGGMAAERGILMRSAEAFQVFKDVDTVALDKTGTITEGRPWVARVEAVGAPDAEPALAADGGPNPGDGADGASLPEPALRVLRLAAVAEGPSEHPLADAILERAREEGLDELALPDDFEAVTGKGVRATWDGRTLLVGTPELLAGEGVDPSAGADLLGEMREAGQTAVLVAADGRLAGVVGISDRAKEDSGPAIARLEEMGVEPVMMTGDAEATARAVAAKVGIDRVLAEMLPDAKAREVGKLQQEGRRVAFVGDGINDAPALTRADVGVAIGAGTDIALESADVVLVHGRLSGVPDAFEVSRNSYRKTKGNLALAFAFNGLGVPVAATGLLHPVWAMAAMVASVSLVLVNSFAGRLMEGGELAPEVTPRDARPAEHTFARRAGHT